MSMKTIREQFIKDVKLAINDEYVEKSYIRELDSKPNDEEKYKFLTEIYQHYFDYFVRDNMPIRNND